MEQALDLLMAGVQAVLIAAIPIITKFVVDWLRAKAKEVESQMKPDLVYELRRAAMFAVRAVEQLAASGVLDLEGRKDYAISLAQKVLDQNGIRLDLDLIADGIEEAILKAGLSSKSKPSDVGSYDY